MSIRRRMAKAAEEPVDAPARAPLDRAGWLAAALDLLREGGVGAVKVEKLAARLGVTKGSFYWHFRDRADLLAALPGWWAERQTGQVVEVAETTPGGPVAALAAVADYLAREDPARYDNAMRAWAQHDEAVAAVVNEIDGRRIGLATVLFTEAGLDSNEARFRARLWYFYDVGEHITGDVPASLAERRRASARRHALLTADIAHQ